MSIRKFKSWIDDTDNMKYFFFKKILVIVLCAVPLILLADEKPPLSYVALLFFLIGMYQLLLLIGMIEDIVEEFFPPKVLFEKHPKPLDQFIYKAAGFFFFIGIVAQLFTIRTTDNTLNGMTLFWAAGTIGLAFAVLVIITLKRITPSVFDENRRRTVVYMGAFIGSFLLFSAGAAFINRCFADDKQSCRQYAIVRRTLSGGRSKENLLFLKIGKDNEERFAVSDAIYNNVTEGGQVELCTQKGFFGYHWVKGFNAH